MASNNNITAPKRCIYNDADMQKFLESPAKTELLKVTSAMGRSCANPACTNRYDPHSPLLGLSPAMAALHGSLSAMKSWLPDFPPNFNSQVRFGNPAFRDWHERLVQRAPSIVHAILLVNKKYPGCEDYSEEILASCAEDGMVAAGQMEEIESFDENDRIVVMELCVYLQSSFGHHVRLDYGTGHECSFQVFLYALCKVGCFGSTHDEPPTSQRLKAVTLSIWSAYLTITRALQTDYMLEPAGSHGVWGLDDYHCLPFYFGACQLQADGDGSTPESIQEPGTLSHGSDSFLYYGSISFIKSIKKGVPFFESSPMLNDISHLASWQKVASGLLKLFEGEVLNKRQVVQHFVFGEIFKANWTPSKSPNEAPQETFRTTQNVAPMVRAPWADRDAPGTGSPSTKAPWAK
jgi:hypothetical protein